MLPDSSITVKCLLVSEGGEHDFHLKAWREFLIV
jgi:hypothetical protein